MSRLKKGKLKIQCDELWSFVDYKGNKPGYPQAGRGWHSMKIPENFGVYIGARDDSAARGLWQSLPAVYRQCAIAYTDFWQAYQAVLP